MPIRFRKFQGLTIKIETANGEIRKGVDRVTGKPWSTEMSCDYGEIIGTQGMDGDPVDVFIGKYPAAKFAFVVHQLNSNTGEFDEDKCMLGFLDSQQAKDCYFRHYDNPKKFYGDISTVPMEEFKQRLFGRPGKQIAAMSKLMSTIALNACGCTAKVGDEVVVDGLRGRANVVSRDGKRVTVKYADGTTLSRDDRYVHPMTENTYKSQYSSLRAGEEMVERENGPVDNARPGRMYIVKSGSLFCVRSSNQADKDFGCYNSREEAVNAMNGRSFNGLKAYGTSEGAVKGWEERDANGEKGRPPLGTRVRVNSAFNGAPKGKMGTVITHYKDTPEVKVQLDGENQSRIFHPDRLSSVKRENKVEAAVTGNTGWAYGKNLTRSVGMVPKQELGGFPKTPTGSSKGGINPPKVKAGKAKTRTSNISTPTGSGFGVHKPNMEGEGVTGSMGNVHIDPAVWFHPPSLSKRHSNEELRVPTDDVREDNDKFGDVSKRNSKDTKEQRMKLLKRSGTGGVNSIPVQTTLLQQHTLGTGGMYAARKSRRTNGIARQYTSYSRRGCI